MRVVLSGGGSGGHIFPALAVSSSLKRLYPEIELLYIGSPAGMEAKIVPSYEIPFQAVSARKIRRLISFSTIPALLSLARGYQEAKTYLRGFKADVVVGTGGYVAAAAALAGVKLGLPTLICSPDRIPGRTNLLIGRFARKVCVTFPESVNRFPAGRSVVTGLPLRSGVVAPIKVTPSQARSQFEGLSPAKFTLLVVGGSQGAQAINECILSALTDILEADIQVIHQAGNRNWEEMKEELKKKIGVNARASGISLHPFLNDRQMPLAFRAADIVLCRGGISFLSETLVNGLPSIIVPLPTAYADHQTYNAAALEEAGASILLPQSSLNAGSLLKTLVSLKEDTSVRMKMAAAAHKMGRADAADVVAKEIAKLAGR